MGVKLDPRKFYTKIGVGILLIGTAAWFLAPPSGFVSSEWRFQWEPLIAFLVACGSFIYSAFEDSSTSDSERLESGSARVEEPLALPSNSGQQSQVTMAAAEEGSPRWDKSDLKIAKQFLNLYDAYFVEIFGNGVPTAFTYAKLQDIMAIEEAAKNASYCFSDKRIDDPFQKFLKGLKSLLESSSYAFDSPDDRTILVKPELYEIDESVVEGYLEPGATPRKAKETALRRRMASDILIRMEGGDELVAALRKNAPSTFSRYERLHN